MAGSGGSIWRRSASPAKPSSGPVPPTSRGIPAGPAGMESPRLWRQPHPRGPRPAAALARRVPAWPSGESLALPSRGSPATISICLSSRRTALPTRSRRFSRIEATMSPELHAQTDPSGRCPSGTGTAEPETAPGHRAAGRRAAARRVRWRQRRRGEPAGERVGRRRRPLARARPLLPHRQARRRRRAARGDRRHQRRRAGHPRLGQWLDGQNAGAQRGHRRRDRGFAPTGRPCTSRRTMAALARSNRSR